MKFCHSLLLFEDSIKSPSQLEVLLLSSALSVAYIKKLGYNIKLYTNELGKKLLKDIPYDDVIDIDYFDYIPKDCYAQSKFAALELMEDDEVHIDYDVFIHSNTFIDLLKNSKHDCAVQYIYRVGDYKFESSQNAINYFKSIGLLAGYDGECLGVNGGFICIKNKELKSKYIDAYKSFYYRGYDLIKSICRTGFILDSYVEEVQLAELIAENNYSLYSVFGDLRSDDRDLTKTLKLSTTLGYEHLCGPKIMFLNKFHSELSILDRNLYETIMNSLKQFSLKILDLYEINT